MQVGNIPFTSKCCNLFQPSVIPVFCPEAHILNAIFQSHSLKYFDFELQRQDVGCQVLGVEDVDFLLRKNAFVFLVCGRPPCFHLQ